MKKLLGILCCSPLIIAVAISIYLNARSAFVDMSDGEISCVSTHMFLAILLLIIALSFIYLFAVGLNLLKKENKDG